MKLCKYLNICQNIFSFKKRFVIFYLSYLQLLILKQKFLILVKLLLKIIVLVMYSTLNQCSLSVKVFLHMVPKPSLIAKLIRKNIVSSSPD